jgi:UDP-N-acetylmuramoylalanine--D-glutamate ligase
MIDQNYKDFFSGKRVTVMGLGLLGRGLNDAKFLAKYCAEVLVTDLKSAEDLKNSVAELSDLPNIKFVLGEHRLCDFRKRDFILKAAGVPLDSEYIAHAKENGIPVYMDEALFVMLAPKILTIGVTGTRGKTTTTMMIDSILSASDRGYFVGGNIRGVATLPLLEEIEEGDTVLMELSSWQLQGFGDLSMSPNIGVFTNFYDDHFNYYKSDTEAYFNDKSFVYRYQKPSDSVIFGSDIADHFKQRIMLAQSDKFEIGASDLPTDIVLKIPGEHNRFNAALAWKVAETLGISPEVRKHGLESFAGVPGRLELVRVTHGISFYNDTTATTPDATVNAIEALKDKGPIILIMGGFDKGLDMDMIFDSLSVVKKIILLPGTGSDSIVGKGLANYEKVSSLQEAIDKAMTLADSGDIVLLSPAFASFGLFKNEFDRGDQFDAIVKSI